MAYSEVSKKIMSYPPHKENNNTALYVMLDSLQLYGQVKKSEVQNCVGGILPCVWENYTDYTDAPECVCVCVFIDSLWRGT